MYECEICGGPCDGPCGGTCVGTCGGNRDEYECEICGAGTCDGTCDMSRGGKLGGKSDFNSRFTSFRDRDEVDESSTGGGSENTCGWVRVRACVCVWEGG